MGRAGERVLPPRQALPERAFLDAPPDRARLVALSCPWLGPEHPDWTDDPALQKRNGQHLRTIAPLLEAYMRAPPQLHAADAADAAAPRDGAPLPVGVYWDFLCVYHDVRGHMLTAAQQQLHTRGLDAAAALFAHCEVDVWLQARLTSLIPHPSPLTPNPNATAEVGVDVWLQARLTSRAEEHVGVTSREVLRNDV